MYKFDSEGYIIFAQSKIPTLDEFMELMGVSPGKLASKIIKFIYCQIYHWSQDLKQEYINYYSIEYDTFEQYLNNMVGIDFDGIDLEKEHIFYFHADLEFLNLNYENNYLDIVMNVLVKNDEN